MGQKTIFLDFDGTLVNSSVGIYRSFSKACCSVGLRPPDFDNFCTTIGPPVHSMVKQFFPDMCLETYSQFLQVFRSEYDEFDYAYVTWHAGVIDGLMALTQTFDGCVYVVTNKPTYPTTSILKHAGLLDCFKEVVGIDYRLLNKRGAVFVDKAEAIKFTLNLADSSPDEAFYIGDTPSDRDSSQKAGVLFIAATYGFYHWRLDELSADMHAHCFSEAVNIIERLANS
jgi:phosphoglycolate phosphatase